MCLLIKQQTTDGWQEAAVCALIAETSKKKSKGLYYDAQRGQY
jgi:hypothetical protein